jgi:hypothetical protein
MIDPDDFSQFEAALANDPVACQAVATPWPDVHAWLAALETPEPFAIFDSWFALRINAGEGDCLFHALTGSDLSPLALRSVRRATAAVRRTMPEAPAANALRVIAALLHTPQSRPLGIALAERGLSQVSNAVVAALQAVPGVFAGEDEIQQWCLLKQTPVLVVDCNGSLREIRGGGITLLESEGNSVRAQVRRVLSDQGIALFKTPGHWCRIVAVLSPDCDQQRGGDDL